MTGSSGTEVWYAPAKINLCLDVTGRRADGYHDVDTVLQAIDLYDRVTLATATALGTTCRVGGAEAGGVPEGDANLAARAARTLAEATGHELQLAIELDKRIPSAGGLGGGSSDAAAVLLGLARRFAVPDPEHTVTSLARSIGADVPFFLEGGTQRARGVGERLEPHPPPVEQWGVLFLPGVGVDTGAAFAALDEAVERGDAAFGDEEDEAGDWRERTNVFEPLMAAEHREIAEALTMAANGPATVARMTGTGSAVFALYSDAETRDGDLARIETTVGERAGFRCRAFDCVPHGVQRGE